MVMIKVDESIYILLKEGNIYSFEIELGLWKPRGFNTLSNDVASILDAILNHL